MNVSQGLQEEGEAARLSFLFGAWGGVHARRHRVKAAYLSPHLEFRGEVGKRLLAPPHSFGEGGKHIYARSQSFVCLLVGEEHPQRKHLVRNAVYLKDRPPCLRGPGGGGLFGEKVNRQAHVFCVTEPIFLGAGINVLNIYASPFSYFLSNMPSKSHDYVFEWRIGSKWLRFMRR